MRQGKWSRLISSIPGTDKHYFWLCILLMMKFTLLYFLFHQNRPTLLPDTIATCSGDCESYLTPIENLLQNGRYEPDYRMPGYGFPYLFFRLFSSRDIAVNLLIIMQSVLDALAALILAISLLKITGRKMGFYLTILFYGVGITVSCYNNWVLTESLTCSVLVFGFYFTARYFTERKSNLMLFAGLFFTWAYFLRPVNAVIIILVLLIILIPKFRWKPVLFFLLPAVIINSAWSIRNYIDKKKIYLLTENTYVVDWYGEYGLAGLEFCKKFSDFKVSYNFFETQGLTYFGQAVQTLYEKDIVIPDDIYTKDFNRDSLILLRSYFKERIQPGISDERRAEIEKQLIYKFNLYSESLRRNHPFIVYVKTPLMLTKIFVMQAGVHNLYYYPFHFQPLYKKAIKFFFVAIYLSVFLLFVAGLFFYKKIFENKLILLSYAIAFYIIFIHSVFLRSIEPRYIVPGYPFFVIAAVYTIHCIRNIFKNKPVLHD